MALSTKTMRGFIRYLPGTQKGLATGRHVVYPDTTTPVYEPLYIRPTSTPSGTSAEGAFHWNDSANAPKFYDGSNWQQIAGLGAAQTWTGVQTFSQGPLIPRKTYLTTQILTAADNGAHCVFSVTTVTTFTLPAAAAGLHFRFSCAATAAGTSDIFRIVCASGDFFIGTFIQSTDGTYSSAAQDANGSTHLAWEGNGSTTGGLKGDWLEITASDSTLWQVYGMGRATGSEATPWKTS